MGFVSGAYDGLATVGRIQHVVQAVVLGIIGVIMALVGVTMLLVPGDIPTPTINVPGTKPNTNTKPVAWSSGVKRMFGVFLILVALSIEGCAYVTYALSKVKAYDAVSGGVGVARLVETAF